MVEIKILKFILIRPITNISSNKMPKHPKPIKVSNLPGSF